MREPVVVVVAGNEQLEEIRADLSVVPNRIIGCQSLSSLPDIISESDANVVILDLDSIPVDNRLVRKLKAASPAVSILAVSSRKFHPELRQAISLYIHACIRKPLDPEELRFWITSITSAAYKGGQRPLGGNNVNCSREQLL